VERQRHAINKEHQVGLWERRPTTRTPGTTFMAMLSYQTDVLFASKSIYQSLAGHPSPLYSAASANHVSDYRTVTIPLRLLSQDITRSEVCNQHQPIGSNLGYVLIHVHICNEHHRSDTPQELAIILSLVT
jgi:hypothetical protein